MCQERGLSDAATSQGVPRLASGHLRLGETRREGPFLRASGGNTAPPTPQLWGAWLSDGGRIHFCYLLSLGLQHFVIAAPRNSYSPKQTLWVAPLPSSYILGISQTCPVVRLFLCKREAIVSTLGRTCVLGFLGWTWQQGRACELVPREEADLAGRERGKNRNPDLGGHLQGGESGGEEMAAERQRLSPGSLGPWLLAGPTTPSLGEVSLAASTGQVLWDPPERVSCPEGPRSHALPSSRGTHVPEAEGFPLPLGKFSE